MHVPVIPSVKSYRLDRPPIMLGAKLMKELTTSRTGSLAVGALVVGDAVGDVGAAVGEAVGEVGAAVGVVVGDVGAEVSGYANEYKSLLGDPAPKPVRAFFVVKFRISVLTSDGDAPGYDWRYSAITPRTYGAAIDVPDLVDEIVSLP